MKRRGCKWMAAAVLCFCMAALMPLVFSGKALAAEEGTTIDVTAYGADPTGAADSTKAIQDAFAAAKTAKEQGAASVTVNFPEGEYHIYKENAETRLYHTSNTNSVENPTKTIGILIEDQEDLTVEGNGSLFIMHGDMMALAVVRSKNVTLHDFSWDFAVPTVAEMTAVDLGTTEDGKAYTDFWIPACCPYIIRGTSIQWQGGENLSGEQYWTNSNYFNPNYGMVCHIPGEEMSRNMYATGIFESISSIVTTEENEEGSTVRITYNGNRPGLGVNTGMEADPSNPLTMQKGMLFELTTNAVRKTAGAFTWESEHVTAREVNVHFMHGFGWLIQMSKDVYYYDCNLTPREGSGHRTVSYADGIHASGAAGELVIENCNFSDTHDDPINLHGTFTRVEQRVDDNTLVLKYIHNQQGGFPQFHVGDQVAFFTRDTLESTDNETLYTVAEVLANPGDDGNDWKTMRIRFEETLPENLSDRISGQPKYVAENVTYAPEVTIRNCTFANTPTRGILCTTRNKVLIEGNTFKNMSMATIYLSNDSNEWYESGPIRDMTIRNNTFYIKSVGRTAWEYAPAVYVNPVTKGGGLPSEDNPIHKNITIEGNTFFMDRDTVVKAESVENLTIRNNKIYRMNPDISIKLSANKTSLKRWETAMLSAETAGDTHTRAQDNAYEFTKCKNVILEGNTYDDGLKLYAVLSGMSETNLTNKDEKIQVTGSRSQPASAPVGRLHYESSNPAVATVDIYGTVTAESAGTAEIRAFYEWNGEKFYSNSITVTVSAESVPTGEISFTETGSTVLTEENAAVDMGLNAPNGVSVSWSVADFATGDVTDAATIDANGRITAKKSGIVWVTARSGACVVKKPVIVALAGAKGVNPAFTVIRPGETNRTLTDDKVTIDLQSGDLYQSDNSVENLFLYQVPEGVSRDNLRTVIHVENLPARESNQWDTASFLLYKDDDNYISVGKKSHYDGFATVVEKNATAVETGGDAAQNELTDAWLGFYMKGSTLSIDYWTGNGGWSNVRTIENVDLGTAWQIGFAGWESSDRGKTVSFSGLRAGSGDMSYEELMQQPAVAFTAAANRQPQVTSVAFDKASCTEGEQVSVTFTSTDPDGDELGKVLYYFSFTDAQGVSTDLVSTEPVYTTDKAGKLSCQVFVTDAKGLPGAPSESVTMTVNAKKVDPTPVVPDPVNPDPVNPGPVNPKPEVKKPARPKLKAKYTKKTRKVKLSWQKKTGASQIEIWRKTGKGKYKKIKTISAKKTSLVLKLKKGKTYTFRIRGKVKVSGKKYLYSKYSVVKKVRAR